MKKLVILTAVIPSLIGCVSTDNQLKEALRKNPKIIFDVIEENPDQFIEVVNRAAQKSQQKQYEKQIAEMKSEQDKDLKTPKQPKLSSEKRLVGDDSGKIVIVEYADFQCPACKMAYGSLKEFKEKHKGQIQFYYKNLPLDFHKMAYPSAQYFEAIRLQDKTKAMKFYDYVFENQSHLADEGFLKKAAVDVGANLKRIEVDIKSDQVKKIIEGDMNEFQSFGFTGTPMLILNGVALYGAQKLDELERITQLTLKK